MTIFDTNDRSTPVKLTEDGLIGIILVKFNCINHQVWFQRPKTTSVDVSTQANRFSVHHNILLFGKLAVPFPNLSRGGSAAVLIFPINLHMRCAAAADGKHTTIGFENHRLGPHYYWFLHIEWALFISVASLSLWRLQLYPQPRNSTSSDVAIPLNLNNWFAAP